MDSSSLRASAGKPASPVLRSSWSVRILTLKRPIVWPAWASKHFLPNPIRRRKCAANWSNSSMSRVNRPLYLCVSASVLFFPILSRAQTSDIARILERLDRLETENRALGEQVRQLQARLDGAESK